MLESACSYTRYDCIMNIVSHYFSSTFHSFHFYVTFNYFSLNHFFTLQGGDTLDTAQYRPITIPSNILRLITVRMCARMTRAAEENGLLGPEQFGFRKGRSTMDAVFVLTTMMKKAMKNR